MNAVARALSRSWRQLPLRAALATLVLAAGATHAAAGTLAVAFRVTVPFVPVTNNSAYCTRNDLPGAFGASVTVICRTGAPLDVAATQRQVGPIHGGAYRYLMHVPRGPTVLGTIDADAGIGTATYWRVVDSMGWSYVEMGIAW